MQLATSSPSDLHFLDLLNLGHKALANMKVVNPVGEFHTALRYFERARKTSNPGKHYDEAKVAMSVFGK